ncbi:MAG: hypothetical protein ACI81R_002787 [Bradymonadia bacterium]|jgi:hypothetical protein
MHVDLSPSDTLRGQLQRGLGRGYLGALASREISLLLECVLNDARWDRQIEERAAYYANLAIALAAPVDPLADAVCRWRPGDRDGNLAVDVLVEMARRGHSAARQALSDAARGSAMVLVFEAVFGLDDAHLAAAVGLSDAQVVALLNSLPSGRVKAAAELPTGVPWERWIHDVPTLRDVLGEHYAQPEVTLRQTWQVDRAMSTEGLLRLATERWRTPKIAPVLLSRTDTASRKALRRAALGSDPALWGLACRTLGRQGDVALIDAAREMIEGDVWDSGQSARRASWSRYLQPLPPELTLPFARRWVGLTGPVAVVGRGLLAVGASASDLPLVTMSLERALDGGELYAACTMVEALTHIGEPGQSRLLERAFVDSPYSWIRWRVLDALQASADPLGPRLAREALWDCDCSAREAGAAMALLDAPLRERLAAMQVDEFEELSVREAASARLGG